ncbi:MAG: hypothetical protein IJZ00_00500 [Lachnospiraceae bacterium]|nr:hypothetical protein [Lachnospiraceae bacterium]
MPDQKWISYTTYTYEYGNCGECLTVIETDEESTNTTTYTYDKLFRLTSILLHNYYPGKSCGSGGWTKSGL